ncbi:MAG: hypothetical protein ACHBNF_07695, partial [Chromatiales bacterium]
SIGPRYKVPIRVYRQLDRMMPQLISPRQGGTDIHSRIGRGRFRTDKSDDVIRVAKESVATFQRQPGFQSVVFHYDRASGWGVAVSLWDTKEHAAAALEGTRSVTEQFAPFRVTPGQQTPDTIEGPLPTFEVIAQG